ncbi:hypothetical protein ACFVAF_04200 [Streptomyces sp. NPDC057596]|uniref:hypothetical protein n=1 Tax=Streptomyces sp. NPDC057596 TaxID=3346178 RepID=UPI00368D8C18
MPSKTPGAWPVDEPLDLDAIEARAEAEYGAQYMRIQAERARWHHVFASLRQYLTEQPNPRAVRAALRRIHTELDRLGDDVIADMTRTETNQ